MRISIIIGVLIFFNTTYLFSADVKLQNFSKMKIKVNEREINVLVADNEKRREQGLSGIEISDLTRNGVDGMLFIFEDSGEKTFQAWHMKFDLMLLVLEKIGDRKFIIKYRKPLRIGTIEKIKGRYVLEIPLKSTITGAK